MPEYKLTYFDLRGAGEIARQIFVVAGVEFIDNRISKTVEWPELKQTTKFGQVPILELPDGRVFAQSHAIARYLAKKFGFNGKDEIEEVEVNEITDQYKDYFNEIRNFLLVFLGFREGDKDKMFKEEVVPAYTKSFGYFDKILTKNGTGFLVGDSLTWADLLIASHLDDVVLHWPSLLEIYPSMKTFKEKIHSIPALKKWIETRPVTNY